MLRWEAILLVLISLLWIHSCDGERHQAAKKGDKPRSNDAIPGSSALSSEVQGTPEKSVIDETGLFHRHVQKGLQEGLYINHYCVPCPPVSYSTCFSYEDAENTKEDPDNPKQAVEGDFQIEYSLLGVQPKHRSSNKNLTADYPEISSRILNHVPSFQGLDAGHSHHKHGGIKPGCAQELPFCLYDNDYPIDAVHDIINNYHDDIHHMYHGLNHYSQQEYMTHDNHTHGYRHKGNFVCESDVTYIRPGWAKNWNNKWVAVVNTEKYPQSIRVELCKFGGKRCEYLPPCYKSFCVQRYAYIKMLCVDPFNPHHRPIVDVFEIPTACSCFVENFVYY